MNSPLGNLLWLAIILSASPTIGSVWGANMAEIMEQEGALMAEILKAEEAVDDAAEAAAVVEDDLSSSIIPTTLFANYGETCTTAENCDSSAYLTCVNGSCQCALNKAMTFDDASSSCWVLPGAKCIYRASQIGLNGVLVDIAGGEERTAHLADRVSFRCVSNAACEDGYCTCDSGYFATANGTCERQRENGEDCQKDEGCRQSLHLICDNGKCGCNVTNSVYDLEHGLCVGLSGSSCFDFELCTENAYCPSFGIFNQYDVKCTCKPGYYETEGERTCKPRQVYGADCAMNEECREDFNLICDESQGKCLCNSTSHMYDYLEGKCVSLVGSACSEVSPCVPNADCQHAGFLNGNVLSRSMVCKCAYGYFENDEKTCERKKEYESECEEDSNCREDLKLICNKVTGVCGCNETIHAYDRSRRRCIALAGTSCERNEQCVINSVCRSPGYLYPRHTPKAECICKDGFYKSVDGYCLGKYGSRCESWTNSCKETLTCRNMECTCKLPNHQQYYDYSQEKCLTYVGVPCDGSNETTCIQHAFCGETEPGVGSSTTCRCYNGFMSMDNGRMCLAMAGQKCSEGEDELYMPCIPHAKCDRGLCKCALDYYTTENGTCERKKGYGEFCTSPESCEDSYCDKMSSYCGCNTTTSLFDPTRKTCMRLAGAKCYDLRDCVPNALCRSPGRLNPVDSDATCLCKEGYYKSVNGTCEWKRGYGESCTDSVQCQDAADLICTLNGKCECNTTVALYDEKRRTCLRLAGATCSSHQQCISHAKCRNPLYWIHYDSFSPQAKCECETDQGYTNSTEGRCIIDYYGGKCDVATGQHCSPKFVCEDGKCLCPYEDHQTYDKKLKTCISLVKGPCENGTTPNNCVKNAHCIVTEEGVSECRCKHGFIAVDRGCELTFGQPCATLRSQKRSLRLFINDGYGGGRRSNEIQDQDQEDPRCDRLAPLKCIHGTCQCGGFQFYDYELQKCRGSVGSRCSPEDKDFCSEGAICEAYRGLPEMAAGESEGGSQVMGGRSKRYGRCKCKTGYVTEADRSCSRIINLQ